jgi:hypothetical protein
MFRSFLSQYQEGTSLMMAQKGLICVYFYKNIRTHFFFGHKIWTEGVLVTHLSSNAGISVYKLCEFRQIAI